MSRGQKPLDISSRGVPGEPWERKVKGLRDEIEVLRKGADRRVESACADMRVLVDVAQAAQARAEHERDEALSASIEAGVIYAVRTRRFHERLVFRLRYLFTGRIV